ncbi:MAG TPA: TonB family protein [Candidatus Acidoferrales bacterium]|jgi:TonB family protein|nr:TonB family protein [Candidatus Acidoferrales bacterium]
MAGPTKQERLDSFEIQLAPKEWVIRLADELRRLAAEGDAQGAMPTEVFLESQNLGPFTGLFEQANRLRPGNELEDIRARNRLSRKLQTEYEGMKALILKVNEAVKEKTESLRTKVALELCTLYKLILDDGLVQPSNSAAGVTAEQDADDVEQEEENESILDKLAGNDGQVSHDDEASFDDEISNDDEVLNDDELSYDASLSSEAQGNGLPHGRLGGPAFASLIESWVSESTNLIITVFAHKSAAQTVQEKYFNGHPILFEGVENKLDETIKAMEDAAATFNEYIKIRDANFRLELNRDIQECVGAAAPAGERQSHLALDIPTIRANVGRSLVDSIVDEWVEYAKKKAMIEVQKGSLEPETLIGATAGGQKLICEIPVTVQGSRNTRTPQPFLEETYTAIIFPTGAVLRLAEVVTHGQIVIIRNVQQKHEVACRVISFQPSASMEGNAEIEFIEPAPGFWGITFPGEFPVARIEPHTGAQAASPVLPRWQAQPALAAPTAPVPRIEEKRTPAPSAKEEMPAARKAEVAARDAAAILAAKAALNPETPTVPAVPPAPAVNPATPDIKKSAPASSQSVNEAILAAYGMPAPAPPKAPSADLGNPRTENRESVGVAKPARVTEPTSAMASGPQMQAASQVSPVPSMPTAPLKAPAPKSQDAARSETWDAVRALVQKSKSAAPADPSFVSETIELIETIKGDLSKPAPELKTKESKPSPERAEVSTSSTSEKRRRMLAAVATVGAVIAIGAGTYFWRLRSKAVAAQPAGQIATAAAAETLAVLLPSGPPAGTSATQSEISPGKQQQSALTGSNTGNGAASKPVRNSANAVPRQPATLPFRIAAPVIPSANDANTKSNGEISAPEVGTKVLPASGGEQNVVLGSIVSANAPPAPPAARGPATSDRNFMDPRVLATFPVVYPKLAIINRIEGEVVVTAMVDQTGKVIGTKVNSGPEPLRQAAVDAVRMWRFVPARLNGKPTDAFVSVKVSFKLPR